MHDLKPKLTIGSKSIRDQYKITAILIAGLLVLCTICIQWYISYSLKKSTEKLNARAIALNYVFRIQKVLILSDAIVSDHLLWINQQSIEKWKQKYHVIIDYINQLEATDWSKHTDFKYGFTGLRRDMQRLKKHTIKLLHTRMSIDQQLRRTILPMNRRYMTAINQALEAIAHDKSLLNSKYHANLIQARELWHKIISGFRMYLINRLASISENSLKSQSRDIELYYGELLKVLKETQKNQTFEAPGFEHQHWFKILRNTSKTWFHYFNKAIQVSKSIGWRADRLIQHNTLQPVRIRIAAQLRSFVERMGNTATQNTTTLSSVTENIIWILWLVTLIGFSVIIIVYYYFDSTILKPIARVADALQAEATGKKVYQIPDVNIAEIRNLINAFAHLRNQVHERQTQLKYQAMHDSLTQLPNRFFLESRLNNFFEQNTENTNLSLMILDLNRFKAVNDSLGHHIGDEILAQAGNRISQLLHGSDIIARWGGDEFAILLPESSLNRAATIAEKIAQTLANVFNVDNNALFIGASIGIAHCPIHTKDPETLLKYADIAMYVAKRNRQNYCVFNANLANVSNRQVKLVNGLTQAIKDRQLNLTLRPVFSMSPKNRTGVEVLILWQHESQGLISTRDIITIAEHQGVIFPLMEWAVNNALDQFTTLSDITNPGLDWISIDLPSHCLNQQNFIDLLARIFSKSKVDPNRIELTVPEKMISTNCPVVSSGLHNISKLGTRIAIDGYGLNDIPASVLQGLPIQTLRIDPTLIHTMVMDGSNAVAIRAIITRAHDLGYRIIATGIENQESLELIRMMGADYAQGDLLSPPHPATELSQWLEYNSPAIPYANKQR